MNLQKVKDALSASIKEKFDNIFHKIATLEDVARVKENQLVLNLTPDNKADLNKIEAKLKKYLRMEEEF